MKVYYISKHFPQSGNLGLFRRAAYRASEGEINLLTKVSPMEWAPYNGNVDAVAPTFVETPMTKPMFQDKDFSDYVLGNIPLGRVGKPQDMAGGIIYLASDSSDLLTGHILLIDGGWTAH